MTLTSWLLGRVVLLLRWTSLRRRVRGTSLGLSRGRAFSDRLTGSGGRRGGGRSLFSHDAQQDSGSRRGGKGADGVGKAEPFQWGGGGKVKEVVESERERECRARVPWRETSNAWEKGSSVVGATPRSTDDATHAHAQHRRKLDLKMRCTGGLCLISRSMSL